MAENAPQGWGSRPPPPPPKRRSRGRWRPHWRLFTWVIIAFNLVMLLWLIFGIVEANKDICATKPPEVQDACRVGSDVGTVIGVGALVFLWMAGAVILGVLWLVTNSRKERRNRDHDRK